MRKGRPVRGADTAPPGQQDLFGGTAPSPDVERPRRAGAAAPPAPAATAPAVATAPAAAAVAAPIPASADALPSRPSEPAGSAATASVGGDLARAEPVVRTKSDARPRVVLSVGELTRQIKGALEQGFPRVTVRGEISGFRGANVRGHLYFSLKDKEACVDGKIWASVASRMKFKLRDGLEVIAEGSIDLYEPQGRYSLIIHRIEPAGEGALALAFQQMKERLMAEGLFGDKRTKPRRPIPLLPRRIGVVTSVTGAALRDFLRVLHQRHPRLSVLVADARVQGEGSAQEVARGIKRLARTDVDVIVVTRGGGSIEDLWTFNEELVARAIFDCPVPVISAIGHEVDHTISDFVADYRAPTPSAAAEKLAPVLSDLELHLSTCASRLRKAVERQLLSDRRHLEALRARVSDPRRLLGQKQLHLSAQADTLARLSRTAIRGRRDRVKVLADRLSRQDPQTRLRQKRQELRKLTERLQIAMREALRRSGQSLQRTQTTLHRLSPMHKVHAQRRHLESRRARVEQKMRRVVLEERRRVHGFAEKLDAMSPLKVMARGYAVTFRAEDGHVVRRAEEVQPGDALKIRLAPGGCQLLSECDEIDATVTAVQKRGQATFPDREK